MRHKSKQRNVTNLQIQTVKVLETLAIIFPGAVVFMKQLVLRVVIIVHFPHVNSKIVQLAFDMAF